MPRWSTWIIAGLLGLIALSAQAQLPRTQCVSTALASGTGDAIAIPLLPCTETTTLLVLTLSAANTISQPTISVNGQTPHVIVNFDGSSLGIGFFAANQRRVLTYNGVNWIVLNSGSGSGPTGGPFDIPIFWPGIPPDNAIVRIAITRTVTCSAGLVGSVGNSSVAATSTATITLDRVTSGSAFVLGTAIFPTGQTVANFSASGFVLSAGDDIQFAFPASHDATLADVAITLQCVRT